MRKRKPFSEEYKKEQSERMKKWWANPENRRKRMKERGFDPDKKRTPVSKGLPPARELSIKAKLCSDLTLEERECYLYMKYSCKALVRSGKAYRGGNRKRSSKLNFVEEGERINTYAGTVTESQLESLDA